MFQSEIVELLKAYAIKILDDRTAIFLRSRNKAPKIFGSATPAVLDSFVERVLASALSQGNKAVNAENPSDAADQIIAREILNSIAKWEESDLRGAEAWQLGINFLLIPRKP